MKEKNILGAAVLAIIGFALFKKPKGEAAPQEEQPQEPQGGMVGGGGGVAPITVTTTSTTKRFLPKFTATMIKDPVKKVVQNDKFQSADMGKLSNVVLYKPPTTQELKQSCERGFTYSTTTKRCEPNKTTYSGGVLGGSTGGSTYGGTTGGTTGGSTGGSKSKQGAEMLFSGKNPLTLDTLLH
jgi:hypothetical protein